MAYPFLSLSKRKYIPKEAISITETRKIGSSRITQTYSLDIIASEKYGMPTIWDFDIFLCVIARINKRINSGEWQRNADGKYPTEISFAGYDLLTWCGRSTSARGYKLLEEGLNRLENTKYTTNLINFAANTDTETKMKSRKRSSFSFIANFKINEDSLIVRNKDRRLRQKYTVFLQPEIAELIPADKQILKLDNRYFNLTGGIERWMFRLASQRVGDQSFISPWSFKKFMLHSGNTASYRDFKFKVKRIIETTDFPKYGFTLFNDGRSDKISMWRREHSSIDKLNQNFKEYKELAQSAYN